MSYSKITLGNHECKLSACRTREMKKANSRNHCIKSQDFPNRFKKKNTPTHTYVTEFMTQILIWNFLWLCRNTWTQDISMLKNTGNTIKCISSVQLLSRVQLFATPWTAAHWASLSITSSWSWHKPMSIESVMPFNYLILCRPLLLLPSIFPSIGVFSNESALCIRWPKYWIFSSYYV